jgi:hypothetical protein
MAPRTAFLTLAFGLAGCASSAVRPADEPRALQLAFPPPPQWSPPTASQRTTLAAPPPAPAPARITEPVTLGTADVSRAPRVRGRPVDLDLRDADIRDVCRLLADVGHTNIVVADGVTGSITLRMRRVPWDQALDVILRAKGYRAERDGDVILVLAR